MAEKIIKVETYLIDYICDKCKKGKMMHTSQNQQGAYSPNSHKCYECGNIEELVEKYPKIKYIDNKE